MTQVDLPLQMSVQFLPGVGAEMAKLLRRLGIRRVHHLLFYFPREYELVQQEATIDQLKEGTTVSVEGTIAEIDGYTTASGQTMTGILVRQGEQFLRGIWFNQTHITARVQRGQRVRLTGRVRSRGFRWEMAHPQLTPLEPGDSPPARPVMPVYALTAGIKQGYLRRLVSRTLGTHVQYLEEILPEELRRQRNLLGIRDAVQWMHQPVDEAARDAALRRFRYQELFMFQLALAWQTAQRRQQHQAPPLPLDARINARIRRLLPFELTADQDRVVREIAADMGTTMPMQRLLQGDVGCGKTLVSAFAMLLAIAHGHQAALMVPTELLAHQHFEVFRQLLAHSRVRMALLVGSLTAKERRERIEELGRGDLDLVVGTHALAREEVTFHRLGLVVVDEQHKFGVMQRAELGSGALRPHYLTMSATPIPRTLARAVFGDLEVSTINEAPPGRPGVHTYLAEPDQRDKWWDFFTRKLREGRQGIVVSPYVDQADDEQRLAAEQLFEALANGILEPYQVDAVHGRMTSAQRQLAMDAFRRGQTQVLIATSLIEVGIDVPNATVMTIEHADRFGLAQLHQLRGRVGRGVFPGYVCLFTTSSEPRVLDRLRRFTETRDGFEVAELDLSIRGPGELLGTRQHGVAPFRVADLVRDAELLELARGDVRHALGADPKLSTDAWRPLRELIERRFRALHELGDSG